MIPFWVKIFGEGRDLTTLQMSVRALIIFFITLILIRIAGRRTFGLRSPFDNVLMILLGAILSRPVVGASPFLPTVAACLIICILHRLFAIVAIFSPKFGNLTKGEVILLYKNDKFINRNMIRSLTSKKDVVSAVRSLGLDSFESVDTIYMERNGQISVLLKKR